jgi:hypothetical protein
VRTYLQFWVRKESLVKASGLGVDRNTAMIDVAGDSPITVDGREIRDINLGHDLVGAAAVAPGTEMKIILDETVAHTPERPAVPQAAVPV